LNRNPPRIAQPSKLLWIALATVSMFSAGLVYCTSTPPSVPNWFADDPAKPYAIFDAWKQVSNRRAAVVLGGSWNTIGGVLTDQRNRPLPLTPLRFEASEWHQTATMDLITDLNGYFIVYGVGVGALDVGGPPVKPSRSASAKTLPIAFPRDPSRLFACPGYPDSHAGRVFADSRKEMRLCDGQLLMKTADRAFYHFTVKNENSFTPAAFLAFQNSLLRSDRTNAPNGGTNWLSNAATEKVSTEGRARNLYPIQVVDAEGKPLPQVSVEFTWHDNYINHHQLVESDKNGEAELEEWLLTGDRLRYQGTNYFDTVRRSLIVRSPQFVTGPVHAALQAHRLNVIKLKQCATISGKVLDDRGNPLQTPLTVIYQATGWLPAENEVHVRPDGSFAFDRVMPDEPFQLSASWPVVIGADIPRTAVTSLRPAETRSNVLMRVLQTAAIRGIVVDSSGESVNAWQIVLDVDGAPRQLAEGDRFSFQPLGQEHLRIRINAKDHLDYQSDPIQLQPGEVRFLKATLEINPGKLALKPLRAWLEDLDKFGTEPYDWAQSAVRKLGTNTLPELLTLLRSADARERHLALNGFETLGNTAAPVIPELIRLAQSSSAKTSRQQRECALHGLADIKAEESVRPVIDLIENDNDDRIRDTAIWALGRIGKNPALAIPVIEKVLQDRSEQFHVSCVYALGDFGSNSQHALPLVMKVLDDENAFNRSYASNALLQINPSFARLHGIQ
jgi:hypothetical protein